MQSLIRGRGNFDSRKIPVSKEMFRKCSSPLLTDDALTDLASKLKFIKGAFFFFLECLYTHPVLYEVCTCLSATCCCFIKLAIPNKNRLGSFNTLKQIGKIRLKKYFKKLKRSSDILNKQTNKQLYCQPLSVFLHGMISQTNNTQLYGYLGNINMWSCIM